MDKLDLILQKLDVLTNMVAAYGVILVTFMIGIVLYLRDFKERHTLENLSNKAFQFTIKQAKKVFKPRRNLGDKQTTPDALPLFEKFIAEHWLKTQPRIMEFTEEIWRPVYQGKFNRDDWVALMARWKVENIVKQRIEGAQNGKGRALIAARGEVGMERKLKVILDNSPASSVRMSKTIGNPG